MIGNAAHGITPTAGNPTDWGMTATYGDIQILGHP
jgi:hypothetical protein